MLAPPREPLDVTVTAVVGSSGEKASSSSRDSDRASGRSRVGKSLLYRVNLIGPQFGTFEIAFDVDPAEGPSNTCSVRRNRNGKPSTPPLRTSSVLMTGKNLALMMVGHHARHLRGVLTGLGGPKGNRASC